MQHIRPRVPIARVCVHIPFSFSFVAILARTVFPPCAPCLLLKVPWPSFCPHLPYPPTTARLFPLSLVVPLGKYPDLK